MTLQKPNPVNLSGKTALVTGASRGIGTATARRLHLAGANVVLVARSLALLEKLASELGDRALAVSCDVSQWHSVTQASEMAVNQFGSIDILVNNAGIIEPIARIAEAEPDSWNHAVDVNLKGVFHCVRAALPGMKAQGAGLIVNISSGAATQSLDGWSHYCASKAGVLALTRCIHLEEARNGIRCVGLSPGSVATDMQKVIKASGLNPMSKREWSEHIPPDWAAEAVAWLTTPEASEYDGGDLVLTNNTGREAVGLPRISD
ncbi:MAG: SDR family oxidoreductase [Lysobacterales bacterium]